MKSLFSNRAFVSLFATQFLAAFNDNLFKNLLVMWLTFSVQLDNTSVWVTAAAALFVLPFMLFSPIAGQLADKWPRHVLIRVTQTAEVGIMAVAVIGFWLQSPSLLLGVLFLMGLQSTLFGPVKYSVLPHFFHGERLVAVNSWWSGGTFVAIVLGTLAGTGGFLLQGAVEKLMAVAVLVSLLGAWAAWRVPAVPAASPDLPLQWHILKALRAMLRTFQYQGLAWVMVAISGFWMVGAMVLSQIPLMAETLGSPGYTLILLLLFAAGIGVGAALAWYWNRDSLHLGWTGLWYGLIAGLLGILVWAWPQLPWVWWPAFTLLAVVGGVMVVPLYVWLQRKIEDRLRGRLFAALNVLNALFMVVGTGGLMVWHLMGL